MISASTSTPRGAKTVAEAAFDIDVVMARVEEAVEEFPKAALFELAERGFATPFEQAVACIISIRTRDEVTVEVAPRLFAEAPNPQAMAELGVQEIEALIVDSAFHEQKAGWLSDLASTLVADDAADMPCDGEALQAFSGIGPKCAALVLSIACDRPSVAVDVHVHRITNRWGYVSTKRPEQTMAALEEKLPRQYWVDVNRLLIPFGKHICTGRRPRCSACPVSTMCRRVGVSNSR
ncbi:MAG: endonuclease III domain-containing protein [Anaerolineae bacterium]